MGRVAPYNLLWSRKWICSYLWKVRKSMKWQMTVGGGGTPLELQEGHLDHHLLCATLRVTMNKSVRVMWRNQSLKSGETKTTSFPSGFHHSNQIPHNSLSSSRYSLLFRFVALKQLNINFNMSTPINQKLKSSRYSRRLTLRLLSFVEEVLLPNSTMSSNVRSWTWEFSNSQTSSRSYVRICALGLLSCLGANNGIAR